MPSLPPQINAPPIYVKAIDDHLRIGSFVHVHLAERNFTTIARIHSRIGKSGLRFVVYPPLFPKDDKPHPSHGPLPTHHYPRILISTGCRNVELYQSRLIVEKKQDGASIIICPAFVFTYYEFKHPKNAWTHGLKNVFIVRFEAVKKDPDNPSCPISLREVDNQDLYICFPNEHQLRQVVDDAIRPPRCFHQSAFVGLFMIRKALFKLLNKCSGQSEEEEVDRETIGLIPTETWTYIVHLCRQEGMKTHETKGSASYLDVEPNFTRKKVRMEYPTTIIRFESPSELQFLRGLLGFGSTYGSTERKPTLKDGPEGVSIKPDHRLTVVNGVVSEDSDNESNFKVRSRAQRVDLCWSDFHCQVVVGYEQYQYSVGNDGKIRNAPPNPAMSKLLRGDYSEEDPTLVSSKESSDNSPSHKSPRLNKNDDQVLIGQQFADWDDENVYEVISVDDGCSGLFVLARVIGGPLYDHDLSDEHQKTEKWEDIDEVKLLIRQYN